MRIGVLTSGGDAPGMNAAIRAVVRQADALGHEAWGIHRGYQGLLEGDMDPLPSRACANILQRGGTMLHTARCMEFHDPVHRALAAANLKAAGIEALVVIGGDGSFRAAETLQREHGVACAGIPGTIDNDLPGTERTLGFDTALGIATDAIDRLHSTAHSHHRIILVELMGHNAGWLALGAGIAGGADVILIPEIPFDPQKIAEAIMERSRGGKRFSIVAVSEGAMTVEDDAVYQNLLKDKEKAKSNKESGEAEARLLEFQANQTGKTMRLAQQLEVLTGLESRVTILGYVQRGGTPSAVDRLLGTELGSSTAAYIANGLTGVMVAIKNNGTEPVPIKDVVGKRRSVPLDHVWVETARRVGTCLGD